MYKIKNKSQNNIKEDFMNIRQHIINNFKGDDNKALKDAINESLESKDEITLPGLGVFFELVWNSSDEELKNTIIEIIKKEIEKETANN